MPFLPPFDSLIEVIRGQAVEIASLPESVAGERLKQETWLAEQPLSFAERAAQLLPPLVQAVRIDGTPVLMCSAGGDASDEGARDLLRRLRNQATIARSWLEGDAPNLQVFVALGSADRPTAPWLPLARDIETDDRICRKLVWLIGRGGETPEEFLSRTFLATPWATSDASAVYALDALSTISLPEGWSAVLEDEGLDTAALVRALAKVRDS